MNTHELRFPSIQSADHKLMLGVSLIYWILSSLVLCVLVPRVSLDRLFPFFFYLVFIFLAVIVSVYCFERFSSERIFRSSPIRLMIITACAGLFVAILLEAGTVIGTPGANVFSIACWSKRRLVAFVLIGYILASGVMCLFAREKHRIRTGHQLRPRRAVVCRTCRDIALSVLLSLAISIMIYFLSNISFFAVFGIVTCVLVSAYVIFIKYKEPSLALENVFAAIALLFGIYLCVVLPITSGIAWDDQIHFKNASDISYVLNAKLTPTEEYFSNLAYSRAAGEDVLSISDWGNEAPEKFEQELNSSYEAERSKGTVSYNGSGVSVLSMSAIGYIPSAVGLWFGRLLHVPFSMLIVLGRLGNLLAYTVLFYFAIKIAPTKKTLFFVVGIMPGNIFLASNYSYDPWITSLVACGVAILMREMWGEGLHVSKRWIVLSLVLMTAGIMVKAVYCPVLGLYFLMPKKKFDTNRQRWLYYAVVIAIGILLLSSFSVPFLSSGGEGTTDSRGGSSVNATEQFGFILSNPMRYFEILFRFLFVDYFNPWRADYILNLAYLGRLGWDYSSWIMPLVFNLLPLLLLCFSGLIEGNENSEKSAGFLPSLWSFFTFVLSFALFASALYIGFTPVGYFTINGCQGRYLIPWLIPLIVFGFNSKFFSKAFRKMSVNWSSLFLIISTTILAATIVTLVTVKFI